VSLTCGPRASAREEEKRGGALGWAEELGWGAAAALLGQDKKGGKEGRGLGRTAKWAKREGKGMARWAGLPRTRRKEEVGVGPWLSSGRDSGGGEVLFLFFFSPSFNSKPISNPF